ncbi:alpha/beta fold hydrolase [Pseudohoeflea coraliihabitans]|uniref:Alpha/beta fold hydrolase n=1 Tax=Pseudohoeflea coraliihabitans TaxID=2860393 RepID=A0ABS6WQH7_9HYPH|nr:alpha/beta hydrolase [Pseudohoeflea sp. DP4N28-3]MBW3098201.1 alpha/beta fold hydrolase [Pseudohoeflea sp. DP4N28-3]
MNLTPYAPKVAHNGALSITWYEGGSPDGFPVLLIHGFASTAHVNWVHPGWFKALGDGGYRVIALDNRGHGHSDKPHDPAAYTPEIMAGDAAAVLDAAGVERAHVFGYSMGARISCFLALDHASRVARVVFGGLGSGLVDGVGDWDAIAAALLAPSLDDVEDERGRMFRAFAEQTGSDRKALAACIRTSRKEVTAAQLEQLQAPALVGVGSKDEIAGSASALADMLPNGRAFEIAGRDHMLAVGDKSFKAAVLDFLGEHGEAKA